MTLQLFRNYRQEWRNKSTHDYNLAFDENEAFVALTSVTSFVHLLLKQIQVEVSYIAKQERLKNQSVQDSETTKNKTNQIDAILDVISEAIVSYIETEKQGSVLSHLNLNQITGRLHAYLSTIDTQYKAIRDDIITDNYRRVFNPDFVIEVDGEKIIVELKKSGFQDAGLHTFPGIQNEIPGTIMEEILSNELLNKIGDSSITTALD